MLEAELLTSGAPAVFESEVMSENNHVELLSHAMCAAQLSYERVVKKALEQVEETESK